eukprot:m.478566 g.478566  ORF g.478566 m.478566 type:complete len:101 (-) comp21166_c0_seq1:223-525(-)
MEAPQCCWLDTGMAEPECVAGLRQQGMDVVRRQGQVPRASALDTAFRDMFVNHMLANTPVVLERTPVDTWNIHRDWIGADGTIDLSAIEAACGNVGLRLG